MNLAHHFKPGLLLALGLMLSGCETTITPEHAAAIDQRQAYLANPEAVFAPELAVLVPQCLRALSGQAVDEAALARAGYPRATTLFGASYARAVPVQTLGVVLELPGARSCSVAFLGDTDRWPELGQAARKVLASNGYQAQSESLFRKGDQAVSVKIRASRNANGQSMALIFQQG